MPSALQQSDRPTFIYDRPKLYRKQREALFGPERGAVVEANTKAGKTHGSMAWLLEQAFEAPDGANLWWVAPVLGQAKIAFRRYKRALPKDVFKHNDQELTLTLFLDGKDVVLWFKSGDNPDLLYGEDVYAVVIDEASRTKDEVWHAVHTTLVATRGKYRIIGNVKGTKNWAYRLGREAIAEMEQARREGRDPTMRYSKITAADAVKAGIIHQDVIDEARRRMPEHVFKELYYAEPSEDGGNPFGIGNISTCQMPVQSGKKPEVFGLDLASKEDYTVLIGLDEQGLECFFHRFQLPWGKVANEVVPYVGSTPCLVDSTGVGAVKLDDLQEQGGYNFQGFAFTQMKKQQLMENIAVMLANRQTGFHSQILRDELEAIEWVYSPGGGVSYGAPSGYHDDCVMAYGLALWLYKDIMPSEHQFYVPGTFANPDDEPHGTEEGGFYVPMDIDGRDGITTGRGALTAMMEQLAGRSR